MTGILGLLVWLLISALVLSLIFAVIRFIAGLAGVTIPQTLERGIWLVFALLALIWCLNHTHIGGIHWF